MISYVIWLTTRLFGATEFGVRFGVCIASLVALWCSYVLASRLYSPLAGFIVTVALGATPLMAVGSLIATYDPLLVCFWAITLVCLERALFAPEPRRQEMAWLGAGVATGLGFLSKHTMLLLLPCLLLFLLLSPAHRRWLLRPQPYLAFGITLLLYGGVFWWNAHHHWWTFGHLLFLTKKTSGTPLRRLGDFIGSQALLLGPGLFLACLAACSRWLVTGNWWLVARDRRGVAGGSSVATADPEETKKLFLFCMGAPVLLFFCLMTFKAKVQANWAPCAWITPAILWAGEIGKRREEGRGKRREEGRGKREEKGKEMGGWHQPEDHASQSELGTPGEEGRSAEKGRFSLFPLPSSLFPILGLSAFLTVALLAPGVRQALGIKLPPDQDVSNTAYGWRELAAHVQQMRVDMERADGRKVFVAGNGYQYTALMAFYLPDHPETHDLFLHFRLTMYAAYVEQLKNHLGEDCLFINAGEVDDHDLRQIFKRVEWQPPFDIWRRPLYAVPVSTIHIAKCYGYRRYVGLEWARGG
jgi:dolichol-phosphate mannosyltransferase